MVELFVGSNLCGLHTMGNSPAPTMMGKTDKDRQSALEF